ncbi:hypothetical protein ACF1BQ_015900 [Bradyrhizobium sp. RDT10]
MGYTFVEKLQTVSTKFRMQQAGDGVPIEFMRHYYDIWSLLKRREVQELIGTEAYKTHKQACFRQADNQNITENEAFVLNNSATRALYAKAYDDSGALYYADRPAFAEMMGEIGKWISRL